MIRERRARSRPRSGAAPRRRGRRRWGGPPGRSGWRAPRWSGGGHGCRRAGEGPGGGRARPPGRGGTAGTAVLRREMCGSAQWCGGAPIPIVLGVTKVKKIGIATAAAVAALVIAAAVAVTAYREKTIGFIADRIAAGSATGVIVQVTDSAGEEVWTAGEAVPGEGGGLGGHSRFRIGSVTKTFVAAVVLQLAEEGRLGLDDPIGEHLPGTVPDGEAITVRRLLDHTSGLYDYMKEPGMSTNRWRGEDRFRSYSAGELLRTAFRNPPYFPPGEGFRYSNTNYVLLGELIEAVTANPYGEEVEKRIIEPLELRDTALPGTDPEIPEPAVRAQGVLGDGRTVDVTEMDPSLDRAAGEMISST